MLPEYFAGACFCASSYPSDLNSFYLLSRPAPFDFFSDRSLDRAALESAFPFLARSTILQDERESLGLLVPCTGAEGEHVKVSFFGAIRFGRVGQPDATEDGVHQVASLDDLMATKLKVVLQRAEAKDYRDIVAMLRAGVKLSVGLAAARALFGPQFQPSESLKALVYFGDGDLSALSDEDRSLLVEAASTVRELSEVRLLSDKLTLDRNGRPPQRPIPVPRNGYPTG